MKTNSSELKEQRKHGPEAMPIKAYTYNAPYGVVPVHCHWHDEMELFLVTKGVARVQCENSFFTAKPGTLFFFSSGELHSAVSGDGGEIGFESIVFHPAILCGIATMSEGHFCRTFKEYTLKTPVEYINSLRVARAMELLNSTDMKIVDVAMETGFNNQSYFIGVFSKFVGTTPAKFRKTEKR